MIAFASATTPDLDHPPASGADAASSAGTPTLPSAAAGTGIEGSAPLRPSPMELEALGDEIARLAAHLHAATYQLLVLIREFDERGGWGGGFRSCAEWLSWRTSIAPGAAREKVRVARALGSLPLISGSMARGELSYSKVRALSRVATAENEENLLETARHTTAAQLERLVRAWRRVDRQEEVDRERARHRSRYLWLYPDEEGGSYVLRGRLDPEVGALLKKALEWAGEALYRSETGEAECQSKEEVGSGEQAPTTAQRRADALGLLAERAMVVAAAVAALEEEREPGTSSGTSGSALPLGRADRFEVVVHVDAEALETGSDKGAAVLEESGLGVSAETSRRLACDAGVVEMRHDPEGGVLDVGRRRRTVPPAIRRALEHRDGGCRFPGCGCRYTDAHHIRHWADGGETRLDSLVLLCRRHHRAVHEEGFRVALVDGAELESGAGAELELGNGRVEVLGGGAGARRPVAIRFYRPDGRLLPEVPASPPVPNDPVGELVRAHAGRGIEPDEWTATPRWWGEALDINLALDMLRHPLRSE